MRILRIVVLFVLAACSVSAGEPRAASRSPGQDAVPRPHQGRSVAPAAAAAASPTRAAIVRRHAPASPAPAPAHVAPAAPAASPRTGRAQQIWADLLAGNRRFVAGTPAPRSFVAARAQLAHGQHPQAAVLGCSDSRVGPELVFDRGLGEVFVVRSAGNVADAGAVASLEYAVFALHVKVVVVLGHERCGAVAAAAEGEQVPGDALPALVRRLAEVLAPLRAQASGEALVHLGVRANVHQAARDLLAQSQLLRQAVAAGELTLVEGVYDLDSGEVTLVEPAL